MSASEENQKRDYFRYDQMSTAELEQLLRLDFQASEDGDSDLNAILYISNLLAERNGLSDPDTAWEQFQTQYRPYADGRSLYDFEDNPPAPQAEPVSPARSQRARRLRRLVILAAALIACLLGGMVVAQAAGVDVWGAIAQWTDETFRFISVNPDNPSSSDTGQKDTTQFQSLLNAAGMDRMFPTWYPDGFTPGDLDITELNNSVSAHVNFFGEDRTYSVTIMHFTQPTNNTGTFEKDDTPVEEYDHNGQTFYILSNIDTLTATTFDGEFLTMICGSLTREEIKAIIDSIPAPLSSPELEQLRESLEQEGQSLYFPKIPEGFTPAQSQYYVDSITDEIFWSQLYLRGEQTLIVGVTKRTGPSNAIYEKDDSPVEEFVYHGITHYIFSNNSSTTATWMVKNTEYYMCATDGAVDMKALIRSAYETSRQ